MRSLVFLSVFIFLISCKESKKITSKSNPTIVSTPVNYSVIKSGINGDFPTQKKLVITNEEEFKKAWANAFKNFLKKDTPPKIDFETKLIILVTMGEKSSGGYTINISDISENKNKVVVTVLNSIPEASCPTTSALTFPFEFIQLDKTTKEIVFKTIENTLKCE